MDFVTILIRREETKLDGYPRQIAERVEKLLKRFPVVVILGARQVGKSTLAKMLRPNWEYFDLGNPNHFRSIENDPVLFFDDNPDSVIIDEAQMSPKLFLTLRGVVDKKRSSKGRFLLTGSASFNLMKNVSESLAGRVGILELSPFKVSEKSKKPLSHFFELFESPIVPEQLSMLKNLKATSTVSVIKTNILGGGYPEPSLTSDSEFRLDWMENYFETYLNRDIRAMFPRIELLKYRRVVSMLSSLSGTILNKSEIARSAEISEKSCRDYLDIISGTYFWRNIPAFTTSKIKTSQKLPKGHFRDSGLTLFLQNIHNKSQLDVYPKLGNVFESFVVEEILRGIDCTNARNVGVYHFRTKAGGEIDLVLEGSFGLLPIEVKFQSNTTRKQLTSMDNFIDLHNIPLGIVVNNCEKPSKISEKIIQIPVSSI